jgi:lipoyl(octanoyl) transferase
VTATPARVVDLGTLDFRAAYDRQLAILEQRKTGAGEDTLLLVEHPHVITVGRTRFAQKNVLGAGDVPVVEIERGGDVTYHGPGQLVAYPIVALAEGERDLHRFLRNLEEAMIRTLADYRLAAGRVEGKTGVWIGDGPSSRKIGSIGIACRRWITFHGLALNVATDLDYFFRINPCGFDAAVMTSMARELGAAPPMADVKRTLTHHLGAALGRRFLAASEPPDTLDA